MANLHKAVMAHSPSQSLLRKTLGEKTYDTFHPLGTALVKAQTPVTPPPVVPMPDTEEIQLQKRRQMAQAALQRGGRASTILTNTDRLGP